MVEAVAIRLVGPSGLFDRKPGCGAIDLVGGKLKQRFVFALWAVVLNVNFAADGKNLFVVALGQPKLTENPRTKGLAELTASATPSASSAGVLEGFSEAVDGGLVA